MLAAQIHRATEEQILILNKEDHSEIERLYPLSFIIALIKQIPHANIINNFSFGSLVKTEKIEQISVKNLVLQNNKLRDYIVQYDKASNYLMTKDMKDKWKEFITNLNEEENKQISQLLHTLGNIEMIPLWINTSFTKIANDEETKKSNLAQILLREFNHTKEFLNNLNHIKQKLKSINIEAFSDPALFDKHFSKFNDLYAQSVTSLQFIENLENSTSLGRLAAITVMMKSIEILDNSIKSLTGSSEYKKDKLHTKRFESMIGLYIYMFHRWIKIKYIIDRLNKIDNRFTGIQKYENKVNNLFDKINYSQDQFKPSFNIAGTSVGSKTNWNRNFKGNPTLESLFSLTHQNLLIIISMLSEKELTYNRIDYGADLQSFKNNIEETMSQSKKIGTIFDKTIVRFLYNTPIRNHSNTFTIIYHFVSDKIFFEAKFIGEARTRWKTMAEAIITLSSYLNIPLSKNIDLDNEQGTLSFGMEVNETSKNIIPKLLTYLSEWSTFQNPIPNIYSYLHDKIKIIKTKNKNFEIFIKKITESIKQNRLIFKYPLIFPTEQNGIWEIITDEQKIIFKVPLLQHLIGYYQNPIEDSFQETEHIKKIIDALKTIPKDKPESELESELEFFCKQFLQTIETFNFKKQIHLTYYGDPLFPYILNHINEPIKFIEKLLQHPESNVLSIGLMISKHILDASPKIITRVDIKLLLEMIQNLDKEAIKNNIQTIEEIKNLLRNT
ncbi:hypothetical protein JKY79_00825 [Candidatus Babeliales bacterium]|nr:hypothetical protein [Candidatus Babeliales bacterium]